MPLATRLAQASTLSTPLVLVPTYRHIRQPDIYLSLRVYSTPKLTGTRNHRTKAVCQPLGVWTGLAVCAGISQVAQDSPIGTVVGGPMLAIIAGMICSSAGLLPLQHSVYDLVWEMAMPLAAALLLLEADLRELISVARTTTLSFLLAASATVIGTLVAFATLGHKLGHDGWKITACLCASYIGGSVNFAAVAAGLGASGSSVVAAMTADVTIMAGYLGLLSSIPAKDDELKGQGTDLQQSSGAGLGAPTTACSMGISLACAAISCSFGRWAAGRLGLASLRLGFSALAASCVAFAAATLRSRFGSTASTNFAGAEALGVVLMQFFFVTIGAAAGSLSSLMDCGWLSLFIAVQLSVHLAIFLPVGRLFKLPMQALLTASNAAIGGPATAAAMCTSRGWPKMVTPALLVGTLGYAIGTPIGMLVACILKDWQL